MICEGQRFGEIRIGNLEFVTYFALSPIVSTFVPIASAGIVIILTDVMSSNDERSQLSSYELRVTHCDERLTSEGNKQI